MPKTESAEKAQVNILLDAEEMNALEAICDSLGINRPSTLVGMWIRTNIKSQSGLPQLVELVKEAQESGVDVAAVLTKAKARAAK